MHLKSFIQKVNLLYDLTRILSVIKLWTKFKLVKMQFNPQNNTVRNIHNFINKHKLIFRLYLNMIWGKCKEKNSKNFKLGPNHSGQDLIFWHEWHYFQVHKYDLVFVMSDLITA